MTKEEVLETVRDCLDESHGFPMNPRTRALLEKVEKELMKDE